MHSYLKSRGRLVRGVRAQVVRYFRLCRGIGEYDVGYVCRYVYEKEGKVS